VRLGFDSKIIGSPCLTPVVGIMNRLARASEQRFMWISLVCLVCGLSCSRQNTTPINTQEAQPEAGSVADRLESLERRLSEHAPTNPTPYTWVAEQVPETIALMATNDFQRLTPQAAIRSALLMSVNSNFVFCQFEYTSPQQTQASFAVFGYERKPGAVAWSFTTTMPTNLHFDK
jgi:hypothetical protein